MKLRKLRKQQQRYSLAWVEIESGVRMLIRRYPSAALARSAQIGKKLARMDSFIRACAGRRITYKELTA